MVVFSKPISFQAVSFGFPSIIFLVLYFINRLLLL